MSFPYSKTNPPLVNAASRTLLIRLYQYNITIFRIVTQLKGIIKRPVKRAFYRPFKRLIYFLEFNFSITAKVPIISTIEIGRQMNTFFTNPAMIYDTVETAATVSAYGICVET